MAERLGLSAPNMSRLLSGRQGPSLGLALKIKKETGIPMEAWAT